MDTPQALRDCLQERARLYRCIRRFLEQRGVLEVETPMLSAAANSDPQIESLGCRVSAGPGGSRERWLRTSPEFFHKRLLAAGSGAIFELGKVFRDGECGPRHNPEFTLLEWYRPGFDHHALMDEVAALVHTAQLEFGLQPWPQQRVDFASLFRRHADIDPLRCGLPQLQARVAAAGLADASSCDADQCMDFLRAAVIEPALPPRQLLFVYDFPASQAALARLRPGDPPLAERFELYLGRVELANGYHELACAREQRARFEADLRLRAQRGQRLMPLDEALLAALELGLPDCAGVALGVDRLLMALTDTTDLRQLLPFPFERA